jgi:D-alanine-D-alanine ligase
MSDIGPVLILAGGLSPEREVSLRSGSRLQALLRNVGVEADIADADAALIPALEAYTPAVVFPVLHGAGGEDGSLQQILTLFGIPYVGATPAACRIAFDKPMAKAIAAAAGVATPPSVTLPNEVFHSLGGAAVLGQIVTALGLPLFVKPARGGSAFGATHVRHAGDLPAAMIDCFEYCRTALIERYVAGTEISVSVIDSGNGPCALPAVEICPRSGSYDYAARYTAGHTEFHTPARLPRTVMAAAAAAAVTLHRALGLRDLSRTDLIVSGDQVFFLEANVMPGLTETSTLPMAVASAGLDLGAVFRDLLVQAADRGS